MKRFVSIFLTTLLLTGPTFAKDIIKKSNSGICHEKNHNTTQKLKTLSRLKL
jgi:hypothetical protein